MQALIRSTYIAVRRAYGKPNLESYDSCEEFSLSHWLQDLKLVEDADTAVADEELAYCTKTEAVPRKSVSEVKPSTADQHLASNVV